MKLRCPWRSSGSGTHPHLDGHRAGTPERSLPCRERHGNCICGSCYGCTRGIPGMSPGSPGLCAHSILLQFHSSPGLAVPNPLPGDPSAPRGPAAAASASLRLGGNTPPGHAAAVAPGSHRLVGPGHDRSAQAGASPAASGSSPRAAQRSLPQLPPHPGNFLCLGFTRAWEAKGCQVLLQWWWPLS